MNKFVKNIFLICILCLVSNPAFADGGIPLWIINAPTLFAATGLYWQDNFDGNFFFSCLFILIVLLIIVILVETIIVKVFLKNMKFLHLLSVLTIGNLLSTIAGGILTFLPIPFWMIYHHTFNIINTIDFTIVGPWGLEQHIHYYYLIYFYYGFHIILNSKYQKNILIITKNAKLKKQY